MKSDPAVSYNEFKTYEGRRYTGMKIGRSHKWYYATAGEGADKKPVKKAARQKKAKGPPSMQKRGWKRRATRAKRGS